MYDRSLDDRTLTFVVSGLLWGRSLVMGDEQTGSEWSHILGEAMAGELKGKKLTILPSSMTNWETWRTKYPHTSVTMIERSAGEFETAMLGHSEAFGIGLVHEHTIT